MKFPFPLAPWKETGPPVAQEMCIPELKWMALLRRDKKDDNCDNRRFHEHNFDQGGMMQVGVPLEFGEKFNESQCEAMDRAVKQK